MTWLRVILFVGGRYVKYLPDLYRLIRESVLAYHKIVQHAREIKAREAVAKAEKTGDTSDIERMLK